MKRWQVTLVTKEYRQMDVDAADYDSAISVAIDARIENKMPNDNDQEWFVDWIADWQEVTK
jgi:hypothetical protein